MAQSFGFAFLLFPPFLSAYLPPGGLFPIVIWPPFLSSPSWLYVVKLFRCPGKLASIFGLPDSVAWEAAFCTYRACSCHHPQGKGRTPLEDRRGPPDPIMQVSSRKYCNQVLQWGGGESAPLFFPLFFPLTSIFFLGKARFPAYFSLF